MADQKVAPATPSEALDRFLATSPNQAAGVKRTEREAQQRQQQQAAVDAMLQQSQQGGGGLAALGPGAQGESAVDFANFDPAKLAPEALSIGGDIVGRGLGGFAGIPGGPAGIAIGQELGGGAGAGIGAGAGSLIRDLARGQPLDFDTAKREALTNAGYSLIGGQVVRGGQHALRGIAGKVAEHADVVTKWWSDVLGRMPTLPKILKGRGVSDAEIGRLSKFPLFADEATESLTTNITGATAKGGLTGHPIMQAASKARNKAVDAVAEHVFKTSEHLSQPELLQRLATALDASYEMAARRYKAIYSKVFDTAIGNTSGNLQSVKAVGKAATRWIENTGGEKALPSGARAFYAETKEAMENLAEAASISDIWQWQQQFGNSLFERSRMLPAGEHSKLLREFGNVYEAVNTSIDDALRQFDVANGTNLAKQFKVARAQLHALNEVYYDGATKGLLEALEKQRGRVVAFNPKAGVYSEIFKKGDTTEIRKIMGLLGKTHPAVQDMQTELLFNLYSKSRSRATGLFNGTAMQSELNGLTSTSLGKDLYRRVLTKQQLLDVKNFAKFTELIQQVQELSPIAKVTQAGLLLGGGTAAGHPAAGAMLLAPPAIAAMLVRHPGIGKSLLRIAQQSKAGPVAAAKGLKALTAKIAQTFGEVGNITEDPDLGPQKPDRSHVADFPPPRP